MARKNNNRRDNRRDDDNRYGKREREARIERMTWFLLVLIFAIIYFIPETVNFPNWIVPAAGALILLGSGVVQYARRMAVSPITWIAGSLMLMMSLYSVYVNQSVDLLGFSLVVFAVVIGFGVITGET
jgi:Na+/H+ antiporter NhaD/arsenite permease-like protein